MSARQGYLVFSMNCFIAAMAAAYIAFSIGLPRPFWAMLTVYITSQPLTGALRSKAVYRVLGTTLGGIAAVVIVPTFVNAPALMSIVIAGWVGFCLYVSLLDRTPRAYVFMLGGYTAAIIGFPSVNAPGGIFDTALARVEEITLGIVCATVVHSIILPRDVGRVLSARIAGFLKDSQAWIVDALTRPTGERGRRERRKLANDITELHVTASHLPFDTGALPLRIGTVRALENRLAYMLPLTSALEDRLAHLGARDAALSRLLADAAEWAQRPGDRVESDASQAMTLRRRCLDLTPTIDAASDWKDLLKVSILLRLDELVEALQDSRDLAAAAQGASRQPDRIRTLVRQASPRRLHLDHGMAALSGASLMVATLTCCALWIGTAWPEGYVAAMMCAVFSSFFAAQDDPAPAIKAFLVWTLAAIPVAAVYLFFILPRIDGFPLLALVLFPTLLVIGYFQANPRFNGAALAMLLGVVGGLALQPTFSADLPDFLNSNLAECVGVAVAMATARLMRSVGAGWAARRILRRGWRDIIALARRRRPVDRDAWTGAMLDRVGLVTTRIALAAPEDSLEAHDALADMRVGLNLIDLNAVLQTAGGAQDRLVAETLDGVAAAFERRLAGDAPAPGLLQAIDRAILGLALTGDHAPRQRGFAALVGLRRNLFPDAAPYAPAAAA
jgi:uncharacterized membrane protein YccC